MRREWRMITLAAATVVMFALLILASASAAKAQEYGESRGALTVRSYLEVSGEGFSANSAVKMELVNDATGERIDLGTTTVDDTGALAGSIAIPDGLATGTYTLTGTGVAADGVTRVLSVTLKDPAVCAGATLVDQSRGIPAPLTVSVFALALALAGGGVWQLVTARRRDRAEGPAAPQGLPDLAAELPGSGKALAWPESAGGTR